MAQLINSFFSENKESELFGVLIVFLIVFRKKKNTVYSKLISNVLKYFNIEYRLEI